MSEALKDIIDEVKNLQSVTVDGVVYDIEYFFGADMKFLAICMGIESATSTYSCVWCKCPAIDQYDINKVWSVTNPEEGTRSIKEIQELSKLRKREQKSKNYGCIKELLFSSIAVDHVIPDILHLFLRVYDVLLTRITKA